MILKKASISLLLALALSPLFAEELEIYFEPRAPYTIEENGKLLGLVAAPAIQALEEGGIDYTLKNVTTNRHLHEIEANQKRICALGWFKNPQRESFGKFTKPLYKDKPMGIIVRADDERFGSLRTIQDLLNDKNIALLTRTSYSYGKFLDEQINTLRPHTKEVNAENTKMPLMIQKKRGDYYFISQEEAEYLLSLEENRKLHLKFLTINGMPEGNERYLLCSKKVEDSILQTINKHLK